MRKLLIATMLLFPLASPAAASECEHGAERQLALDLEGVESVVFHVGPHDLELAAAPAASHAVGGRACASSAELLAGMELVQRRQGNTLHVETERPSLQGFSLFGSRYARFDLEGTVPTDMPVQVKVGSGDAAITGVAALEGSVGSGDLEARRIPGEVRLVVGSGDLEVHDVGSLHVGSVGSGDLQARQVRGDVRIGSIGSGDAEVRDVAGSVELGSLGSGDLRVSGVQGSLEVRVVGSGDVDHAAVAGTVSIAD